MAQKPKWDGPGSIEAGPSGPGTYTDENDQDWEVWTDDGGPLDDLKVLPGAVLYKAAMKSEPNMYGLAPGVVQATAPRSADTMGVSVFDAVNAWVKSWNAGEPVPQIYTDVRATAETQAANRAQQGGGGMLLLLALLAFVVLTEKKR
jgi:hypothetical protein